MLGDAMRLELVCGSFYWADRIEVIGPLRQQVNGSKDARAREFVVHSAPMPEQIATRDCSRPDATGSSSLVSVKLGSPCGAAVCGRTEVATLSIPAWMLFDQHVERLRIVVVLLEHVSTVVPALHVIDLDVQLVARIGRRAEVRKVEVSAAEAALKIRLRLAFQRDRDLVDFSAPSRVVEFDVGSGYRLTRVRKALEAVGALRAEDHGVECHGVGAR